MNEKLNFPISIQVSVLIGSIIIAVSILISGGVIKLRDNSTAPTSAASPAPTSTQGAKVEGITAGNLPPQGDKNAKVLLVEFADYQCPFCGAVSGFVPNGPVASQMVQQDPSWKPYEPNIINDYVKTGKVQYSYRDWPFLGVESTDAANAARCANEQGKFWDYHNYLFQHQAQENSGAFSKDNLKKFASDLGLNASQFNSCVDSGKYSADVTADKNDGTKYGVSGTPTLYINGTPIIGSQSYTAVKAEIDKALASAK